MPRSRLERGRRNISGKRPKLPWKNPFQGGSAFASAKVSIKRRGLHVGVMFKF